MSSNKHTYTKPLFFLEIQRQFLLFEKKSCKPVPSPSPPVTESGSWKSFLTIPGHQCPLIPPSDVTSMAPVPPPSQATIIMAYSCCPLIDGSSDLWVLLIHKHLLLIKSQNPGSGYILQRRKRRTLEKRKVLATLNGGGARRRAPQNTGTTQSLCTNSVSLRARGGMNFSPSWYVSSFSEVTSMNSINYSLNRNKLT